MEVTLTQMLIAREVRVRRQKELLEHYGKTLVSFSMNIPGPVKDAPLIRRGFREGCRELDGILPPGAVVYREIYPAVTGWEAAWVLDLPPEEVKRLTTALEDTHGLGRLFDMDVITPEGRKLDRAEVQGGSRNCLVCGAPGRGCASRRVHGLEQLRMATEDIFRRHYAPADAQRLGDLAAACLVEEVHTTPKPGLVDCRNSGSHRDMDVSTFLASAQALKDYFTGCARIGMATAARKPEETFAQLRKLGMEAEQTMYAATGGVNTHKGAIFTLGILCGAAGRLWKPEGSWQEEEIFCLAESMTRKAMEADWSRGGNSVGHRLYRDYGIRGIRGEAAEGFPALRETGLPVFRDCLAQGLDRNLAGVHTLLHLITRVADTNLIARGGMEGAAAAKNKVRVLLGQEITQEAVETLDDWFIAENLSPGGCADLLAAVYFLERPARFDELS